MALHASMQLHGVIESMERVRFAGRRCDALLLGFADAKVSIVEFDAATRDLATVAMCVVAQIVCVCVVCVLCIGVRLCVHRVVCVRR